MFNCSSATELALTLAMLASAAVSIELSSVSQFILLAKRCFSNPLVTNLYPRYLWRTSMTTRKKSGKYV